MNALSKTFLILTSIALLIVGGFSIYRLFVKKESLKTSNISQLPTPTATTKQVITPLPSPNPQLAISEVPIPSPQPTKTTLIPTATIKPTYTPTAVPTAKVFITPTISPVSDTKPSITPISKSQLPTAGNVYPTWLLLSFALTCLLAGALLV